MVQILIELNISADKIKKMGIEDIINEFEKKKIGQNNSFPSDRLELIKNNARSFITDKAVIAFNKIKQEFEHLNSERTALIESSEYEALITVQKNGKDEFKYKIVMAISRNNYKPIVINYCRNKRDQLVEEPVGTLLSTMYPNMMSEANIRNDFYRQYKEYLNSTIS